MGHNRPRFGACFLICLGRAPLGQASSLGRDVFAILRARFSRAITLFRRPEGRSALDLNGRPSDSTPPVFKFVILVTKGLIRNQQTRRLVMFYDMIFALLMLFAGSSVLEVWLRKNPLIFIAYWAGCAWLTLLGVLLALFDMLLVRASARRARRQLESQYLRNLKPPDPHGEDPPGA